MRDGNRIGLALMLLATWLVAADKNPQPMVVVASFVMVSVGFIKLLKPERGGQQ